MTESIRIIANLIYNLAGLFFGAFLVVFISTGIVLFAVGAGSILVLFSLYESFCDWKRRREHSRRSLEAFKHKAGR